MKKSILFLFFCIIFQIGSAQDRPSGIQGLSFKVGHWQWKTKGLLRPGDPKMYTGQGISHVYYLSDSAALIDDHQITWEDGTDYKAITYRTFDPMSNTFLVVWAQANSSNTTKIIGRWENDRFVETNVGEDNNGKWTNRLEIYDIKADSHKAKLIKAYDNGYQITLLEYEAIRRTN